MTGQMRLIISTSQPLLGDACRSDEEMDEGISRGVSQGRDNDDAMMVGDMDLTETTPQPHPSPPPQDDDQTESEMAVARILLDMQV